MSNVTGCAFVSQFGTTGDANHSGKVELIFTQSDGSTPLDITGKILVLNLRNPSDVIVQQTITIDDGAAGLGSITAPDETFFVTAGDWDIQAFERDNADLSLATFNAPFALGTLRVMAVVPDP